MTRRWPVRVRLAVLCGGLVAFAGALLLAVTFVLLDRIISVQPIDLATYQRQVLEGIDQGAGTALSPERAADLKRQFARDERQVRDSLRHRTLTALARGAAVTMAGFCLGAAAIGWLVSGRALRPVSDITKAAARRIAGRGLKERIASDGPRDELRDLAEAFDDLLARLDTAVDGQWRFVANASHELKTPLAINRTLLEVALGRPDASAQLAQLGQTLLEVNARHERLIDGLLTLARSEHAAFQRVPVDLADVVRRVMDLAGAEAQRAGVEVTSHRAAAPLPGDPVLLERLTLNLLQNAIRHNHAGGWARVTTADTAGKALVTVVNTGPELAGYEIPGLFEPFRRQTDRVGSAEGSGLGLSIVRSVARAHGGEVTAAPRDGGGLVVEVVLPGW